MTKKVAGVLLDFDGVIVDSLSAHLKAWHLAYKELFAEPLAEDELKKMSGRSSKVICGLLAHIGQKPLLAENLLKLKNNILTRELDEIELLPGAKNFILHLKENECPHGIVSNASRSFISRILYHHSIDVPFFTGIEDYSKPKPHPQPYFQGAERMGFDFSRYKDIAVFEDSIHGLKAASAASMFSIGITSQHSEAALQSAGAKLTFPNLQVAFESSLLSYA